MFRRFKHTIDGDKVHIEGQCVITKKPVKLTVPLTGFRAYYDQGLKIQDAFPMLDRNTREYLVSGMSAEGFAQVCGPEE